MRVLVFNNNEEIQNNYAVHKMQRMCRNPKSSITHVVTCSLHRFSISNECIEEKEKKPTTTIHLYYL